MINNNTSNQLSPSKNRPGYMVRTAIRNGVTANVYKPIPTTEGKTQRELAKAAKAARTVGPVMGRAQMMPLVYMRVGNKSQITR